jgi:D-threo-aldose 1-dehydrogenase
LAALALQFSTPDPRVLSTVVGVTSPARVRELIDNDGIRIPGELWAEVEERLDLSRPALA